MKKVKAIACVLMVTMLAGIFAGCSKTTKISTESFAKGCEKLKLEEFDFDDDEPDYDDIEDGIYAVADEDMIEDEPEAVESMLQEIGLDEVIDADDVTSMAIAAKCIGISDFADLSDPEDLADIQVDGAFAVQMTLADDYVEDFMEYVEDMLDMADISSKDLTNKEFYVSKKDGYFRFHIDIAKFLKLVLENEDVMDLVDSAYDSDDFEDLCNSLTGDVSVSIEINGSNIFIIAGINLNTKATVLPSFTSAFGAAMNPMKVPMNQKVVEDGIEFAVDNASSAMSGSYYDDFDDYDFDI